MKFTFPQLGHFQSPGLKRPGGPSRVTSTTVDDEGDVESRRTRAVDADEDEDEEEEEAVGEPAADGDPTLGLDTCPGLTGSDASAATTLGAAGWMDALAPAPTTDPEDASPVVPRPRPRPRPTEAPMESPHGFLSNADAKRGG